MRKLVEGPSSGKTRADSVKCLLLTSFLSSAHQTPEWLSPRYTEGTGVARGGSDGRRALDSAREHRGPQESCARMASIQGASHGCVPQLLVP